MSIHCETSIDRPLAEVNDYFFKPDGFGPKSGAMHTFDDVAGASALVLTVKPHPVGPAKLLGPLLTRIGIQVWNERLGHAKAYLESDKEGSR